MDRAPPEPREGQALHTTAQSDLLLAPAPPRPRRTHSSFSWQLVSEGGTAGQFTPNEAIISGCSAKQQVACYIFKVFFISRQNQKCVFLK